MFYTNRLLSTKLVKVAQDEPLGIFGGGLNSRIKENYMRIGGSKPTSLKYCFPQISLFPLSHHKTQFEKADLSKVSALHSFFLKYFLKLLHGFHIFSHSFTPFISKYFTSGRIPEFFKTFPFKGKALRPQEPTVF